MPSMKEWTEFKDSVEKPGLCPFCGSGAYCYLETSYDTYPDGIITFHRVSCLDCGCDGPFAEDRQKCIKEWNRRA